MLNNKTALKVFIILLFIGAISCRSKREIIRHEAKQETKTEAAQEKTTDTKQDTQTVNQIIASTDEDSQLTIIRYDTEKPVTGNGLPPVLEVIKYNKKTKGRIDQEQTIKNRTEKRTDFKSETRMQNIEKEQTTNESGPTPKRTGIPLPFWFIIFATATGAAIIIIRKSKSALAMGIASRIRSFLNLLRQK